VKLLLGLAPVLVVASAFAVAGDGPSARAAAVGAPIVAGLGLFPVVFALSRRAGFLLGVLIVVATGAGIALAARAHDAPDLEAALGWVALTFACILGVVSPFLVLRWRATAGVAWLLIAAVACGGILLVERGESVPPALLAFNPLVRVLYHGLGFDWLRSANLYPRVGSVFYAYPERSAGIPVAAGAAALGLVIAAMMAFVRRKSVDAEPVSP
jgi:hypothetical protein